MPRTLRALALIVAALLAPVIAFAQGEPQPPPQSDTQTKQVSLTEAAALLMQAGRLDEVGRELFGFHAVCGVVNTARANRIMRNKSFSQVSRRRKL